MKIRRVDKIRIIVLLPLSLAFLVVGSILISRTGEDDKQSILPGVDSTTELLTTEVRDILAQAPEPPSPTPLPTTVPEPPSPTPVPTDIPGLSCSSKFAYSGSGSNLSYAFQIDTTSENNRTTMTIDLRPYIANNNIQLIEYSGNCVPVSNDGLFTCDQLNYPALILFKVINEYQGALDFKAEVEKIHPDNSHEGATCNNSITIQGINTPPTGLPPYSPQPTSPSGSSSDVTCNPYKEYCNPPGANLLDDVLFNQSHDGSFENPICTLKPDNSIGGKGCGTLLDKASYYQADVSALIPFNSQAFFIDTGAYQRPEYKILEVSGPQQCEEKLQAHGNNSFEIFSRGGFGLKGGICFPMKTPSGTVHAGINFRVSQQTASIGSNVDVTFKLGYIKTAPTNNFYQGTTPSLTESSITWVDTRTVTKEDYGSEEGYADRYTGDFLEGDFPSNARGFCIMADSVEGNGINTFWDAGFAYTGDEPVCENALDHSDGIDRSCGGFECGNNEPVLTGNNYTDFTQNEYAFKMPANWYAKQCEYKTETNGAESPYGTLFVGLDINSCNPSYAIAAQREINPDFNCADTRNWTYGFAWTGGIKDFGLLQYLDCSLKKIDESKSILDEGNALKGTDANPYFCDSILKSYTNSKSIAGSEDPAFTIRYTNTYSGLVNAIQAEGNGNAWKVPLLGSAVANRIINNRQDEPLLIDPFLIGRRNSGSGMNNAQKFNLEDFVVSQVLRTEEHLFESSIIPQTEVLVTDLLPSNPVCTNIAGDPVTKVHYGPSTGVSDRAIFGFADDEGSFEHIVEEANEEITPEQLCDYQFLDNRVVGAECTILDIYEERDVTFTEGNIGGSLDSAGILKIVTAPTLAPPFEPGIPDPDFETCETANICGVDLSCTSTRRELYNACSSRDDFHIDEIGGNPFIRWARPNGWKDLQIAGLNKVTESSWHNEFIHYNQVIRHENVGLDVNQVVSVYDQQQPKCSSVPGAHYCTSDSAINKAAQVCRRVEPYNCDCQPSNYSTCLLACKQRFLKPQDVPNVGLKIEGTVVPTLPGNVTQPLDNAIRPILENTHLSFLEKFVSILTKREGEYNAGEVYQYAPGYTGGFLLANTSGTNVSQCSATNTGATGVSQVRLENYYAYGGQLARINERIGFAATNNKDSKTLDQLEINPDATTIGQFEEFINRGGEPYEHIALPYCDLLPQTTRDECSTNTNVSCDCLVRTCEQQYTDKVYILNKYVSAFCEILREDGRPEFSYIFGPPYGCEGNLKHSFDNTRFKPALEECNSTPKTNENFNCDPMANFIISQGFDTPELRLAACDEIIHYPYNDLSQCVPREYDESDLVNPIIGERDQSWIFEQCFGPTKEQQDPDLPAFSPEDRALITQCRALDPDIGVFSEIDYGDVLGFFHSGVDMLSKPIYQNIPIYSSGAGTVIKAELDLEDGFGNFVLILHENGLYTRYAHLNDLTVTAGQVVTNTTQIGHMGTTGRSDNIHLHFEILSCLTYTRSCYVDPTSVILRTRNLTSFNLNDADIEQEKILNNITQNEKLYEEIMAVNKKAYPALTSEEIEIKSQSETNIATSDNLSIDFNSLDPHIYTASKQVLSPEELIEANSGEVLAVSATLCQRDNSIDIVTREEWGAPDSEWEPQCVVPNRFVVHHTVGGEGASDYAQVVRSILNGHTTGRGWGDIGYNYLIAPDGQIFEGRQGGEGVIGAHVGGNNDRAIGISFIGTYIDHLPTQAALGAFDRLINHKANLWGISLKWQETVYGHRDWADDTCCCMNRTQCPGETLYGYLGNKFPAGSNSKVQPEAPNCWELTEGCDPEIAWNTACYEDYLNGIGSDDDDDDGFADQCVYPGTDTEGSFENYECLMIATTNAINSAPGGARLPWQVLWAILYSESWHKCSESHVQHNATGLSGATLLGYSRSGDAIYAAADKCSGNPNQLALHLDANLVDKRGRGVGQFMPDTFDYYSATTEWQYCVETIGVARNQQSSERFWDPDAPANSFNTHRTEAPDFYGRARVGDSLCAAAVKISEDVKRFAGSYVTPQQWTESMVRKAAENYHGSCSTNGSYCNLVYDRYLFALENFSDINCTSDDTTTPVPTISGPQPI